MQTNVYIISDPKENEKKKKLARYILRLQDKILVQLWSK